MQQDKRARVIKGTADVATVAAVNLLEHHGEGGTARYSNACTKCHPQHPPRYPARRSAPELAPGLAIYTDALRSYGGLDAE